MGKWIKYLIAAAVVAVVLYWVIMFVAVALGPRM